MKLVKPDIIEEKSFTQIVKLIQKSKQRAFAAVNKELIDLYWNIGKYIGKKVDSDGWGKGTVEKLARYIQKEMIGSRGFSPQNLWRMSQFYEVYSPFPKLSSLLRELTWTNNIIILSKVKSIEEKEFYINLSIKEKYSTRELERQINSAVYERFILSQKKLSTLLTELEKPAVKQINKVFKDNLIIQVKLTNYLSKPLKRLTKRQFPILDGINPVENGIQKIMINRFNGFYSLVTNLSNSIYKYYRLVY